MKKRILTMVLSVLLVVSMAIPALAANNITSETTGTTSVTYGVTQAFTVTIPADFTLGTTESSCDVSATGVLIPDGKQLTVTMTSTQFDDTDKYRVAYEDSYIKYTVKLGENELTENGQTVLTVAAGTPTGSATLKFSTTTGNIVAATKAGSHTDTLTFTVAVGTAP